MSFSGSLRVSFLFSPSITSGRSRFKAFSNLTFTGRLLLSPGVSTNRGEGIAGSASLYSVHRGLPLHSAFVYHVAILSPLVHRAPDVSSYCLSNQVFFFHKYPSVVINVTVVLKSGPLKHSFHFPHVVPRRHRGPHLLSSRRPGV